MKINDNAINMKHFIAGRNADSSIDNTFSVYGTTILQLNFNDVISIYAGDEDGNVESDALTLPSNSIYVNLYLVE